MDRRLPRGLRNNNPGNIRLSSTRYQGEVPSTDKAFKQFRTMAYGYRAMFVLLYTYQKRYKRNTIEEMLNTYAPPCENNTNGYITRVAEESGVCATCHITTTNGDVMIPIVAAMSAVENGCPPIMRDVEQGWVLFINDYRNGKL